MRVLVVHNRYRSAEPSGENAVVDDEGALLEEHGCIVDRLETHSDWIDSWSRPRQMTLPARVIWSTDGYRRTRRAINRFRPDVVHFHNTFPLLSPSTLWAARNSAAAVVQTLHNFRPLCPAGSFYRDGSICEQCLGRVPVASVVHGCYRGSSLATAPIAAMDTLHSLLGTWKRCVDVFITPSKFAREKYVAAGWPAKRIVVKYNTAPDRAAQGQSRGHFMYLGRVSAEKGCDDLLRGWREAFPGGEQTLRLVGPQATKGVGPSVEQSALGVVPVGRLGHTEALSLLAGARALIVPSRLYEVFPRVIVEAYSLGIPVIASRVGPLPEIVEHGRTGLLFTAGSTAELADRLRCLAGSDELSAELGRGARSAYDANYAPARTTTRLLEIYRTALAQRDTA